jgi:hypothetical protein
MPYKTKAKRQRESWMTLPEVVTHICSTDGCDEQSARRQLVEALADGVRVLGPLRWEKEQGDKSPPFGTTSITTPSDTPPLGRAWFEAEICWNTGRVRDDWGEYKSGEWRVLLIHREHVTHHWRSPAPVEPARTHSGKRGPEPKTGNAVKEAMRKDLREKRLTVQQLVGMVEEALAARYGVSRDTCRKARKAVLQESEFVENSSERIPDK